MDLSDREEEEEEGIMPGLSLTVLGRGTGKYRECLKNHAATMGGHATDGCGEFMPSGEEGSLEALKCAACHCHRNFHRRDSDSEEVAGSNRKKLTPLGLPAPAGFPGQMIMAFGGATGTDEHDIGLLPPPTPSMHHHYYHHHHAALGMGAGGGGGSATTTPGMMAMGGMHMRSGKRFRTKFTSEQKEKMKEFAEKVGWRIQKQDEAAVQRLLAEVGVKRNVFKVWMHNNKNTYTKSNTSGGCLLLPNTTDCADNNNADGNGNSNINSNNNGGNGNNNHHNDENANTSSNNNDEYDDDEDEDDEDDDDEPPSPTPVMIQ